MGLLVVELMMGPDWGQGFERAGASRALTLLAGATWPRANFWVEMLGLDAGLKSKR